GAGLHAGGPQAVGDAVRAHRALVDALRLHVELRDVEGAARHAVAAADAAFLLEVDDAVGELDDRALRGTGDHAPRLGAVHAHVLAHEHHDPRRVRGGLEAAQLKRLAVAVDGNL